MLGLTFRAIVLTLAVAVASAVGAADPIDTLRDFCRLDGRGDRLLPRTWPNVAPLVSWKLEPAWDEVILVDGYQLGSVRYEADGGATLDVTYEVTATVRAGAILRDAHEETRIYHLEVNENGLSRILGPPPPPHVFATAVDADSMAMSLHPENGQFLSDSVFVWQFLAGAGWNVSPFATHDIASVPELSEVRTPQAGDIVVYYDGEQPYHIGVLESEDVVLSATLNAGVRRAPLDAFAGTVQYRRPRADARKPTPAPTSSANPNPKH